MDYREVLDRYLNNVGFTTKDSTALKKARQDFSDALVDIYRKTPPAKTFRQAVNAEVELHEDFNDETLITNLTLSNFTFNTANYESTGTGTLTLTNLQKINSVQIVVGGSAGTIPITNFASGTIKLINELDEEVFSDVISFTDEEGDAETFTFDTSSINLVNLKLVITLTKTAHYDTVYIDDLLIKYDNVKISMPSDFFVPLQVIFEETSERIVLNSYEMHRERFERWTPNRILGSISDNTIVTEGSVARIPATSENIDYDGSIGYTFDVQPEGMYLLFKNPFKGIITVVYSTLPTPIMEDNNSLQIHRAFVDVLVYNATIRGIRKRLVTESKDLTEVQLNALLIALREYKQEYPLKLSDFTNFIKAKAEPAVIKPFDWLNDPFMELN